MSAKIAATSISPETYVAECDRLGLRVGLIRNEDEEGVYMPVANSDVSANDREAFTALHTACIHQNNWDRDLGDYLSGIGRVHQC